MLNFNKVNFFKSFRIINCFQTSLKHQMITYYISEFSKISRHYNLDLSLNSFLRFTNLMKRRHQKRQNLKKVE